ncbi:hypothetical protein Aoki45_00440 [Algoriphagus sp. oki45]|nr:hypothetical protein Aoki45_00440 [Algoriphagus sp. oki45]
MKPFFIPNQGKANRFACSFAFLISLILVSVSVQGQESIHRHVGGTITLTNNGISIIPSFSLGHPAVFFDLTMGGDRFSFDPMLRFGLDGKPWSFVLWGRYKVIKDRRFSLTVGGHPAFLFQEAQVMVDGKPEMRMVANRYVAGEINSSFKVSKDLTLRLYYLKGVGVQVMGPKSSDFLALSPEFPDIRLAGEFSMVINPQFFFLKVDENSGFYVNSGLTFKKGEFPVQFQAFANKKLNSTIPGDDLVWNLSLLYKFNTSFSKK